MNAKELKIVFLGTPDFAAYSLEALAKAGYHIAAAVTAPDKPAGRGQQIQKSAVKLAAEKFNIPVLQPEKLKSPEFLDELRSINPDLMIVVAFRMLPEAVWTLPNLGTFNLHASLLPDYRGAAPINWAIINGEKKTGITTFFLQHEIDTGNIIFREEIEIGENENAGSLHDRMMISGASLIMKTVDAIADGNAPSIQQQNLIASGTQPKEAPKLYRETSRIDWNKDGESIRNHIRGLSPYPGAWTEMLNGNESAVAVKIYAATFHAASHNATAGTVNDEFQVAVKDGWIAVDEIQVPGKKRLGVNEFLKGFKRNGELHFR
jgi:methionyl-tRNA formyltransferase